jgi:hypothetical protein
MASLRLTPQIILEGIAGACFIGFTVLFSPFLRSWYSRWGATQDETRRYIPGNELVPHPQLESTRAITIHSPPEKVWPWLVQIGYKRAGWYSYDILEAMVGAAGFVDGCSAVRIIPELQNLKINDQIFMHPRIPALTVYALDPGHSIIYLTRIDSRTGRFFVLDKSPSRFVNSLWTFHLEKLNNSDTRLIIRSRFDYEKSFLNWVIWRIFTDPISFVMERKMFFGIKKRAEAFSSLITVEMSET